MVTIRSTRLGFQSSPPQLMGLLQDALGEHIFAKPGLATTGAGTEEGKTKTNEHTV